MRFLSLAAALVLLAFTTARAWHAYHATLTELRYNPGQKQLELSIKVFTDDFEKALSKGQAAPVSLAEPGPRPQILTAAYLSRTLQFKTPVGQVLPLKYIGMEKEKDAYWLYCKVTLPRTMGGVQIKQTMLLETFADQSNIVNIAAGSKTNSAVFRRGHEEELVTW
jgi:hypothetical protein